MEIKTKTINLYGITKDGSSIALTMEELETALAYAKQKVTYIESNNELKLDCHVWSVNSDNTINKYRIVSKVRKENSVPCVDVIRYIKDRKPYATSLKLDETLPNNKRTKLFKTKKLAEDYVLEYG